MSSLIYPKVEFPRIEMIEWMDIRTEYLIVTREYICTYDSNKSWHHSILIRRASALLSNEMQRKGGFKKN